MFEEITSALKVTFLPIAKIMGVELLSETPINMMTFLALKYDIDPDIKKFKRTQKSTIDNKNYFFIVNDDIKEFKRDTTIFDGKETTIYLYPSEIIEDGYVDKMCDNALDTIYDVVNSFAFSNSIDPDHIGTTYKILVMAIPTMFMSWVSEVFKREDEYTQIEIFLSALKRQEAKNEINWTTGYIDNGIAKEYLKLVNGTSVYNLLDNGFIVGDDIIFTKYKSNMDDLMTEIKEKGYLDDLIND